MALHAQLGAMAVAEPPANYVRQAAEQAARLAGMERRDALNTQLLSHLGTKANILKAQGRLELQRQQRAAAEVRAPPHPPVAGCQQPGQRWSARTCPAPAALLPASKPTILTKNPWNTPSSALLLCHATPHRRNGRWHGRRRALANRAASHALKSKSASRGLSSTPMIMW